MKDKEHPVLLCKFTSLPCAMNSRYGGGWRQIPPQTGVYMSNNKK